MTKTIEGIQFRKVCMLSRQRQANCTGRRFEMPIPENSQPMQEDCVISRDAEQYRLLAGYEQERCLECRRWAVACNPDLSPGFAWCLEHLVEKVQEREAHRIAREGHESEVSVLLATVHDVYHHLDEAMKAVHQLAKRLPDCGDLPSFRP